MFYNNTNNIYKSSQQGPSSADYRYEKYMYKIFSKLHAHMFLEDLCSHYSISLCKKYSDHDFYKFDGDKVSFENMYGYEFLRYDLDDLLANLTKNLIVFGKAYLEKIYYYDDSNNLQEIKYQCINCKSIKEKKKYICYKIKTDNGTYNKGKIIIENVVPFKLKDIGYTKRFFYKKIKNLKKLELPKIKLSQSSFFDLDKYKKQTDYYLLKLMKGVYWNARNGSNQYFNEPYHVFRIMRFEQLQNSLLEYLISKINTDINHIGKITYEAIAKNYDDLINELNSGEKNCEQIGKVIFKGV